MPPFLVLPFPAIDPVLVQIGPFAIRWYALAYVVGLIGGWLYARWIAGNARLWAAGQPRPEADRLDDLLVWCAIGVVAGGRVGYVLFYNFDEYLANPLEMVAVWRGGMSFHGGLIGCALAILVYCRRKGWPTLSTLDVIGAVAPIGLLLGRLANFVNGELWGRAADVSWAIVFPHGGPEPRHPSQLYEAATEGLLLFLVLAILVRRGGLKRPGLVAGTFGVGYALARSFCELFREPDAQLGFLFDGWLTMGMLLSLPVLIAGLWLLALSRRRTFARADSEKPA
ncbi:MAG: prolipoprotein diacylglyceryl transferase [Rhizobiales bacterium 65-9]|nr:prolipoprotein diacylglyceryl transferase [Hyphomicrobiales bacterium]OJY32886.1 MAG: prolipoprotein diacylglyceryl transferase [Rhizobiales bacterium 65-9]